MSESLTPLNFMVPERQSHEVVTAFCLLDLTLVVVLLDGSITSTYLRFASSPTTLISPCILLHHNMSPPFFPSLPCLGLASRHPHSNPGRKIQLVHRGSKELGAYTTLRLKLSSSPPMACPNLPDHCFKHDPLNLFLLHVSPLFTSITNSLKIEFHLMLPYPILILNTFWILSQQKNVL
jgi:hypothetical protein